MLASPTPLPASTSIQAMQAAPAAGGLLIPVAMGPLLLGKHLGRLLSEASAVLYVGPYHGSAGFNALVILRKPEREDYYLAKLVELARAF